MLISPFSPLFPLAEPVAGRLPFFGLLDRLLATSLPVADAAELAGLAELDGTRGGGIASEADEAVLETDGCRIPVVVGLLDILLSADTKPRGGGGYVPSFLY